MQVGVNIQLEDIGMIYIFGKSSLNGEESVLCNCSNNGIVKLLKDL